MPSDEKDLPCSECAWAAATASGRALWTSAWMQNAARLTGRFAGPGYRFVEVDADHWLPETHAAVVARRILADLAVKPGMAVKRVG